MEGVGVGEGGGDVADSDAESRGGLGKRVGGGDTVGDGDDLAAEKSGGDGLVEGVGVLVVDCLSRGCVAGSGAVGVLGTRSGRAGLGRGGGGSARRGGDAAASAGRAGARGAVGDAGGSAGSIRADGRDGRRDGAGDLRALGGSKSGEGADDDSGELHVDFPGVDGQDELGVGSIGRGMGEREGRDEAVKRKGSGGWEVGCFSQRCPKQPVVSSEIGF